MGVDYIKVDYLWLNLDGELTNAVAVDRNGRPVKLPDTEISFYVSVCNKRGKRYKMTKLNLESAILGLTEDILIALKVGWCRLNKSGFGTIKLTPTFLKT